MVEHYLHWECSLPTSGTKHKLPAFCCKDCHMTFLYGSFRLYVCSMTAIKHGRHYRTFSHTVIHTELSFTFSCFNMDTKQTCNIRHKTDTETFFHILTSLHFTDNKMNLPKQRKVQTTMKKTSLMLNMTAQLNILQLKLLCSSDVYSLWNSIYQRNTNHLEEKNYKLCDSEEI